MHRTDLLIAGVAVLAGLLTGCGTTRVTDTQRTATEQLLVSNAVDQVVSQMDFRALAGKTVYFDPQYLEGTVDRGYLVSSLRQHLLANGCVLQEDRAKATYVVEARSGAVGTDRHSLLFGVPQMNVPALVPGQPSQIPEIPLAKKTDQKAVAKIAVFAYNRQTGRPVFQSGVVEASSTSKDTWVFGTGPFQRGTIRNGTEFAGDKLQIPFIGDKPGDEPAPPVVRVTQAAGWLEPPATAAPALIPPPAGPVKRVNYQKLVPLGLPAAAPKATSPPSPTSQAPAPAKLPAAVLATNNPGGQAETQPAQMMCSGLGVKPEG